MSFGEIGSSVYFEHPLKPWNVSNLSDCLLVVCTANFLYSFMSFPHHLARHSGQNSSDHTTQQSSNLHSEQQLEDTCEGYKKEINELKVNTSAQYGDLVVEYDNVRNYNQQLQNTIEKIRAEKVCF